MVTVSRTRAWRRSTRRTDALSRTVTLPLAAARVVLKARKALPFYGRHPWVLASAVDRVEPIGIHREHMLDIDGQVVELLNDKRKFIAYGIYNSKSRVAVRLYTWSVEELTEQHGARGAALPRQPAGRADAIPPRVRPVPPSDGGAHGA